MKFHLAAFACAGCLVNPLCAQQTWKVNSGGEHGAHFLDLPAAVAAAAPGDTILVYCTPTSCIVYTAPIITKPLRIVGCAVGWSIPAGNPPSGATIQGALAITGIATGEQVILTNLVLSHTNWPGGSASSISIMDCDGSVVLDEFDYDGSGTIGQSIRIERCDHVVVRGAYFRIGGDPIRVIDSQVLLTNTLVSVTLPNVLAGGYTTQTESLFLQRSLVTVVGSVIRGSGAILLPMPSPAFVLDQSTLRIGATSFVQGGYLGTWAGPSWWPSAYTPAYQVVPPAPIVVECDPRAYQFTTPVAHPVTLVTMDETYHNWVVAGENFQVSAVGPSGGFTLLAFGDMIPPTASPLGAFGLDPLTAIPVSVVPLPVAQISAYHWTFACPTTAPNGYAFALQSLTLSPTGQLGLTPPSPLTVGWEHNRIP